MKSVETVRNTDGEGSGLGRTAHPPRKGRVGPDAEARKRGERTELDTPVVHALNDGRSVSGVSTPPVPQLTR